MEHLGTVTSREEKPISKGDNKGQLFLKVTLEPDKWTYSLFDGQHIKTAKQSDSLKITWEEDGKYRSVVDVQAVEGQQAEVLTSGNELRDRRITRTAIAKSCIECQAKPAIADMVSLTEYADFWFNWVWEIQEKTTIERSPEDIQQSQDTLDDSAELSRGDKLQTIWSAMQKAGAKTVAPQKQWCGELVRDYRGPQLFSNEEVDALYRKAMDELVT